jgi:fumarate hydratase class II
MSDGLWRRREVVLPPVIEAKSGAWMGVVKVGRTHLEDATPLSVDQEWSGWVAQLRAGIQAVADARLRLYELAMGGTAVGTGLTQ